MSEQKVEETVKTENPSSEETKKKVGRPKIKYRCDICGDEFDTKAGLYAHVGSKHANMNNPSNDKNVEKLEIERTEKPKEEKPRQETKKPFNWKIVLYIIIIVVSAFLFYYLVIRKREGDSNF